jgi:hypothetical protein
MVMWWEKAEDEYEEEEEKEEYDVDDCGFFAKTSSRHKNLRERNAETQSTHSNKEEEKEENKSNITVKNIHVLRKK